MTIDTTYLDSDSDNVKAARPAILAMAEAINAMNWTDPTFTGFVRTLGGMALGVDFGNPATGSTVTLVAANRIYLNIGTSTKPALTFDLPASPFNGQVVRICTDAAITSLTVRDSAGVSGNVINAPASLAVGGFCEFAYRTTIAKWYRVG